MRATILGWSTASGFILGLFIGIALFAVVVISGELAAGIIPRLAGRVRAVVTVFAFVVLPLAGATLGWLEGRLKLQ